MRHKRTDEEKTLDLARRVTNIIGLFIQASATEKNDGLVWYQAANTFAKGLAKKYNLTTWQCAGIIAAISPQISWERNMLCAEAHCAKKDYTGVYMANKNKAARIWFGAFPLDVLGGKKVRAFYNCIFCPESSESVVVDRHAFDIAEGQYKNKEDDRRGPLGRNGVYEEISAAYVRAAEILNLRPHQVQAVTWLTWRVKKKNSFAQTDFMKGD